MSVADREWFRRPDPQPLRQPGPRLAAVEAGREPATTPGVAFAIAVVTCRGRHTLVGPFDDEGEAHRFNRWHLYGCGAVVRLEPPRALPPSPDA